MFKSKLGNKGFAVSSVLYTLLVAFLLFLGAALAEFSTSAKLLSKANEDMTDGLEYDVKAVYYENGSSTSIPINNLSEFPYTPTEPTKAGSTFTKFLSYDNGGNINTEDYGTLYCMSDNSYANYSFPIKYGNIKNFAKSKKCTGDIEIRYKAEFTRNAKPILFGSSGGSDTKVFGSTIVARNEIETIEFSDTAPSKSDGYWYASLNKDDSVKAYYTKNSVTKLYKIVIVGNDKIFFPKDSSFLFSNYTNLKSITFGDYIDTSEVENMEGMFSGGVSGSMSLERLNLTGFKTSKVTNISMMFENCKQLKEIVGIEGFDTTNVTKMVFGYRGLFYNCKVLKSLNLSGWEINNVTDMKYMFYGCESLTELNIKKFTFDKVTSSDSMLSKVPSSTTIYVKDKAAYNFINDNRPGHCTTSPTSNCLCSEGTCP